jgi:hypothetical protein
MLDRHRDENWFDARTHGRRAQDIDAQSHRLAILDHHKGGKVLIVRYPKRLGRAKGRREPKTRQRRPGHTPNHIGLRAFCVHGIFSINFGTLPPVASDAKGAANVSYRFYIRVS